MVRSCVSLLLRTTAITAVSLLVLSPSAYADDLTLPTNGRVIGGSASISSTSVGKLDILQSTNRVVIDWDSFNIGKDASVEFFQPNRDAWAVNRVFSSGSDPTKILGSLKSNANIMVLDRNGVIFGKDSRIDVGGIIASAGGINTEDFMRGATRFNILNMSGDNAIINDGSISVADGGLAAFVAPMVRNNGTITAHAGKIALASGNRVTVDFYGDSLIEIAVPPDSAEARILNKGLLDAQGGRIEAKMDVSKAVGVVSSVVNNKGIVQATSAKMIGDKIVLSAGKALVTVQGSIQAEKNVSINGGMVDISEGSSIDAGTTAQPGNVLVSTGNKLTVAGHIDAKGGNVETSAIRGIAVNDTAQIRGDSWLLKSASSMDIKNSPQGSAVYAKVLEDALNNGTIVNLQTVAGGIDAGNIDLFTALNWSTDASLAFDARGDIHFSNNSGLIATGKADMTLKAGDDIRFAKETGTGISTNGGDINLSSGDITLLLAHNILNANGGNILIDNKGALLADANTIATSGEGTIQLNQNKTKERIPKSLDGLYSVQGVLDALQNTGAGLNTVHVGVGGWTGVVTINKNNINLLGSNKGIAGINHATSGIKETSLGPPQDWFAPVIEIIDANNILVDGFSFYSEVNMGGVSNVIFRNNVIKNPTTTGVTAGGSNITIARNLIDDPKWDSGIAAYNNDANSYLVIADNVINNANYYGIYVEGNGNIQISGNKIYGDQNNRAEGIFVINTDVKNLPVEALSNYLLVSGNILEQSFWSWGGIGLQNMRGYIQVTNNRLTNYRQGINVSYNNDKMINDLTISNNKISNFSSGSGVSIEANFSNLTIKENIFNMVGNGIEVWGNNNDWPVQAKISDNVFTNIGLRAIDLENIGGQLEVTNNIISDSYLNGVGLFSVTGQVNIHNNNIEKSGSDGVYIQNYSNNSDENNEEVTFSVVGNSILNSKGNGILFYNQYGDAYIDSNTISGTDGDGVKFSSKIYNGIMPTLDNVWITNNYFSSIGGNVITIDEPVNNGGVIDNNTIN